jgi:hypothetical protein
MAKKKKDPAFLFYPADFLIGCLDLNWMEKGQYITLLCIQHQKGRLSESIIKMNIGDFTPQLQAKFKRDRSGLWYNERLENEIIKREKHADRQRGNVSKRWGNDTNSIPNLYQNDTKNIPLENENINENKGIKSKKFLPPTKEEVIAYFEEKGYRKDVAEKAYLYYTEQNWHDSAGKPVKSWKGKMVAVWFKDENKKAVRGKVNLAELSNERKNNFT